MTNQKNGAKVHPLAEIAMTRLIEPRSVNQSKYLESIYKNTFTFGIGLAGTGKTLLATWAAVQALLDKSKKIERIVVVRPVIGNKFGESIGALPGNILEKMIPYGSSVIDNMSVFLERHAIEKLIAGGYVEFIPLTLLRGRSLNNCFVIVEEAQNIKKQANGVYMVMSRLGVNSKMVFNGDLRQSDLIEGDSALKHALQILTQPTTVKNVGVVELNDYRDVQRNPALIDIMERFGELENDPFQA
jgi:phosphate starvation-inducible PhoH-like protein